jgi:phage terminase small subunit
MPILKNQRHEIFCQEIVKGKTADEAYQNAGYARNDGNAARLKGKERISKRIAEIKRSIFKRVERKLAIDVDRVTQEFARIGLANVTDVIAIQDGRAYVTDTAGLSEDVTAAIAEIRQTKDGVVIKMHDKAAALTHIQEAQHWLFARTLERMQRGVEGTSAK